jgi:hypothetical protein
MMPVPTKNHVDKMLLIQRKIMGIFYRRLQNARAHPIVPALTLMINRLHPQIMVIPVRSAAVDASGPWTDHGAGFWVQSSLFVLG